MVLLLLPVSYCINYVDESVFIYVLKYRLSLLRGLLNFLLALSICPFRPHSLLYSFVCCYVPLCGRLIFMHCNHSLCCSLVQQETSEQEKVKLGNFFLQLVSSWAEGWCLLWLSTKGHISSRYSSPIDMVRVLILVPKHIVSLFPTPIL